MDAIERAEHFIANHPLTPDACQLEQLLHALRDGAVFDVEVLYELPLRSFELAMEVLAAWRLQRYYRGPAGAELARST